MNGISGIQFRIKSDYPTLDMIASLQAMFKRGPKTTIALIEKIRALVNTPIEGRSLADWKQGCLRAFMGIGHKTMWTSRASHRRACAGCTAKGFPCVVRANSLVDLGIRNEGLEGVEGLDQGLFVQVLPLGDVSFINERYWTNGVSTPDWEE